MQVRASPSLLTGSTRLPGFHFDRTLLGDNPTCKRCRSSRDMLRSRLPFHPGPGEDPPRDLDDLLRVDLAKRDAVNDLLRLR